jgi:hypothetical protein
MKAKTAVWRSADGSAAAIRDLETSHLQNLAAYLQRRADEHERLIALAEQQGFKIGPMQVQGESVIDWVLCILNELARRRRKEVEGAKRAIEKLNYQVADNHGEES